MNTNIQQLLPLTLIATKGFQVIGKVRFLVDGFKTKDAAEKVAQLVITKIRKGEMPPTVTTEELKALNVIQ